MVLQTSSLEFTVRRHPPELIAPANHTPHEIKLLSDIDDQHGLRCHVQLVQFYRYQPLMEGKDPVKVIREALAKTLVFYYPLAGRLSEGPNGKLTVDCNGEGVMFIEADADVTLEQFGNNFMPPFPCFDELLYNFPGSDGMIDTPLLVMQVTRLNCGGFIFASSMNHTMLDGIGMSKFLHDVGEIARGATKPSILPVWHREVLCARNPPRITCTHNEYQQLPPDSRSIFTPHHRSFFFGPKEIASMRSLLPPHLATKSTSFEILTAYLWRCRTFALQWQNPDQEVRLLCIVNARFGSCMFNPPLPNGYYGNAIVFPAAVTTVGKLLGNPLGYALELVKKAKDEANEEYVHSVADLMAIKGRPCFTMLGSFMVSDLLKTNADLNFGWGKGLYTGVAKGGLGDFPGLSFYVPYINSKGEQGRVVPICLPKDAIERFEKVLDDTLIIKNDTVVLMSNM
ncbi:13-hydroxylupanine O-tigloyltransferase-like [Abrus precatorius]|uniref:13-hydroxylupanine O-tigloyltransferase-like n=1 Tax=Abrus precatorius TaxID=3816 RepID=A0A8B8LLN2_ABRPR|nr:13-hydroxylupanine O-tigloyltransferase-like [Abrus precatorius]